MMSTLMIVTQSSCKDRGFAPEIPPCHILMGAINEIAQNKHQKIPDHQEE